VAAVLVPLFVLTSQLYRGMHWPTDVVASVLFTTAWLLLLLLRAVLPPPRMTRSDGDAAPRSGPPRPPA